MDISTLKTPAQTRRAKALSFLPAAAWYAVIFAFSAQTGEESGRLSGEVARRSIGLLGELGEIFESDWDAFLLLTFFLRKAAHMGIYFILTALLLYGLWRAGFWPGRRTVFAAGACALLAGLDEFHQTFVPGRDGKLSDALIDLSGGLCFLLFWWAASAFWKRKKTSLPERENACPRA